MAFNDLKKNRGNYDVLVKKLEDQNTKSSFQDDRLWLCQKDKAGNGTATIRFLPPPDGEDVPWVKRYNHGFKNDQGKWFIENCPTSVGKECPCCDANGILWNSGFEANRKYVSANTKRKLSYYANVYVLKDPANPENEGKVFLFRFGQKIFDKIQDKLQPEFDDQTPINVFDFWEGADFVLRMTQKDNFANFDKSEFKDLSPLLKGDDKKLEAVYGQLHSLAAFLADSEFKPFKELEANLNRVNGKVVDHQSQAESNDEGNSDVEEFADTSEPTSEDSKSADDYFSKLAAGD